MSTHRRQAQGFTLIELMLAIAFLGTLIVFVTLATISAIGIYNKGLAVKQINQAGRALVEDINRLSSSGLVVDIADNGDTGYLCVEFTNYTRAYIWNSEVAGLGSSPSGGGGKYLLGGEEISLIRTNDEVDAQDASNDYCVLRGPSDINVNASTVTSILTPQVRVLSVDIVPGSISDPELKKIVFWIGTSDGSDGAEVPGMQPDPVIIGGQPAWSCRGGSIGDFCAVSKFETILYAPNKRQ